MKCAAIAPSRKASRANKMEAACRLKIIFRGDLRGIAAASGAFGHAMIGECNWGKSALMWQPCGCRFGYYTSCFYARSVIGEKRTHWSSADIPCSFGCSNLIHGNGISRMEIRYWIIRLLGWSKYVV